MPQTAAVFTGVMGVNHMPTQTLFKIIGLPALAILFSVLAGGSQAQANYYGSFYYNKDTGSYGYAYNYTTEYDAQQRGLQECSSFGSGCVHIVTFEKCGAFAEARLNDGGYSYGYSYSYDTLQEALDAAMEECVSRNDGYKCGIIMYACNTY